jgi:hypothetical protein
LIIHVARVSASFKHGMTTDTSRGQEAVEVGGSIDCSIAKWLRCRELSQKPLCQGTARQQVEREPY